MSNNTNILCPECLNEMLKTDNYQDAECTGCNTKFTINTDGSVRYK